MSVVSVKEIDSFGGEDGLMVRRYTRVFRVVTNAMTDGVLTATNTALLPSKFSTYQSTLSTEIDLGSTLRDYDAKRDSNNPCVWIVECKYSSERASYTFGNTPVVTSTPTLNKGSEAEANPTLRPPQIRIGGAKMQEAYTVDGEGTPVLNSSQQRYESAPVRDKTNQTITIIQNETSPDPNRPYMFNNTVNSAQLDIAGVTIFPGEGKVHMITLDSQWENNYFFWQVTYEIEVRRSYHVTDSDGSPFKILGWEDLVLDAGTMEIINGKMQHIKDKDGVPVTSAMPLNGSGRALPIPGSAGAPTTPQYHWRVYRPYEFADHKDLDLPKVLPG